MSPKVTLEQLEEIVRLRAQYRERSHSVVAYGAYCEAVMKVEASLVDEVRANRVELAAPHLRYSVPDALRLLVEQGDPLVLSFCNKFSMQERHFTLQDALDLIALLVKRDAARLAAMAKLTTAP